MDVWHSGHYVKRHDRIVNHLFDVLSELHPGVAVFNNKITIANMFRLNVDLTDVGSARKPDLLLIDEGNRLVYIIEISCPFDAFLQENYTCKFDKYAPLNCAIQLAGYRLIRTCPPQSPCPPCMEG